MQNETANAEKANYMLLVLNFHATHSEVSFLQLRGAVGLLKPVFCRRAVLLCSVACSSAVASGPSISCWLGGPRVPVVKNETVLSFQQIL